DPADGPTVFLRTHQAGNQAALDALLARRRLTALVTTPLSDRSVLKVRPSAKLREAHPKLDAAKALFLGDPKMDLAGLGVLPGNVLFAGNAPLLAWVAAGVLLVLGALCLFLMFRGEGVNVGRQAAEPPPPVSEGDRGRLAVELPLSEHRYSFQNCFL